MLKKIISASLIIICLFALSSCKPGSDTEAETTARQRPTDNSTLEIEAVVKEKYNGSILVKVKDSTYDISDLAYVLGEKAKVTKDGKFISFSEINVGHKLYIKHKGHVAETYPVQLIGEKEIRVITEISETASRW